MKLSIAVFAIVNVTIIAVGKIYRVELLLYN